MTGCCGYGPGHASYCQKLCMGLSCGGAILAFSIHEFDASNDLGELIKTMARNWLDAHE